MHVVHAAKCWPISWCSKRRCVGTYTRIIERCTAKCTEYSTAHSPWLNSGSDVVVVVRLAAYDLCLAKRQRPPPTAKRWKPATLARALVHTTRRGAIDELSSSKVYIKYWKCVRAIWNVHQGDCGIIGSNRSRAVDLRVINCVFNQEKSYVRRILTYFLGWY